MTRKNALTWLKTAGWVELGLGMLLIPFIPLPSNPAAQVLVLFIVFGLLIIQFVVIVWLLTIDRALFGTWQSWFVMILLVVGVSLLNRIPALQGLAGFWIIVWVFAAWGMVVTTFLFLLQNDVGLGLAALAGIGIIWIWLVFGGVNGSLIEYWFKPRPAEVMGPSVFDSLCCTFSWALILGPIGFLKHTLTILRGELAPQ